MNFDDILSGSNKEQNNYNHKPFNKDEWVKRKNEERKIGRASCRERV